MDSGAQHGKTDTQNTISLPRAPNPNTPSTLPSIDSAYTTNSAEPLRLDSPDWDIWSISGLAALRTLALALETLTLATGDIPPTPPISRPTTPSRQVENPCIPTTPITSPTLETHPIGSPEAYSHEPIHEAHYIQHAAISRRFFSKTAPPISISEYLERLHKWCPLSPGVYLAAAHYIHTLCVAQLTLPATSRTVHRLTLAAVCVAAKALEDNKWPQERLAAVGGVSKTQLMNLEVTLCFLLDFGLWVDVKMLGGSLYRLQQAGRHGAGVKGPLLRNVFKMSMPCRKRTGAVAAAS